MVLEGELCKIPGASSWTDGNFREEAPYCVSMIWVDNSLGFKNAYTCKLKLVTSNLTFEQVIDVNFTFILIYFLKILAASGLHHIEKVSMFK